MAAWVVPHWPPPAILDDFVPLARIPRLVPCRFLHLQVRWIEAAWIVTKVTDLEDVVGLSAPRKLVQAVVRNEGQMV